MSSSLFFFICLFPLVCVADAQDTVGNEFLLSFANNYLNNRGPSVILTNESPYRNASVLINIKGMESIQMTVNPKSFQRVRLPIGVIVSKEEVNFPAVHITSDVNITVVGLNDAHINSAGGFLALPVHTLGTNYVAGTYTPWLASQVVFAALEDDTNVRIRVSKSMSYGFEFVSEGMIIALKLNSFEAMMIEGQTDLTGTIIFSDKNIAVFSGNRAIVRPLSTRMVDHTVEQLLPFKSWGKHFVLAPFQEQQYSWNLFRIVVRNYTSINVKINNTLDVSVNVGHYYEFTLDGSETAEITSTYPVSVFHYAQTKTIGTEGTDMSITNVSPIEQYINNGSFITYDEIDDKKVSSFLTVIGLCQNIINTIIDNSTHNFFTSENIIKTVNPDYCFARAQIMHPGLHFINGSRLFSVLYVFTATSSYALPIALGLEERNCKTVLPDGKIYEHDCNQEIIPVHCQCDEISEDVEEDCYDGYSGLQVFIVALFCAGGAICIDLIIRCLREATEPTRSKAVL